MGSANGNISVAAEVEVDLKGVSIHDDPHPARSTYLCCQRVVQGNDRQRIGNYEFLEQPKEDALPSKKSLILCERKLLSQILREAFGAIYGARGQRRKKDHICRE